MDLAIYVLGDILNPSLEIKCMGATKVAEMAVSAC